MMVTTPTSRCPSVSSSLLMSKMTFLWTWTILLCHTDYYRNCVLGYVIKTFDGPYGFPSHRGRDVTSRMLMHFNQISLDINDDG